MHSNDNKHLELHHWIHHYIWCHSQVRFIDLGMMLMEMMTIASSQDCIGWRNFIKGRISVKIASLLQRATQTLNHVRILTILETLDFTVHLKDITRHPLIVDFLQFYLHENSAGYLQLKECTEAAVQIDSLMQVRPSSISADGQQTFPSQIWHGMTNSDTQQYWITAMNTAIAAISPIPPDGRQLTPSPRSGVKWTTKRLFHHIGWQHHWPLSATNQPLTASHLISFRNPFSFLSNKKSRPDWTPMHHFQCIVHRGCI